MYSETWGRRKRTLSIGWARVNPDYSQPLRVAPLINAWDGGGGKGEFARKGYFLRSSSPRYFEYSCSGAQQWVCVCVIWQGMGGGDCASVWQTPCLLCWFYFIPLYQHKKAVPLLNVWSVFVLQIRLEVSLLFQTT